MFYFFAYMYLSLVPFKAQCIFLKPLQDLCTGSFSCHKSLKRQIDNQYQKRMSLLMSLEDQVWTCSTGELYAKSPSHEAKAGRDGPCTSRSLGKPRKKRAHYRLWKLSWLLECTNSATWQVPWCGSSTRSV